MAMILSAALILSVTPIITVFAEVPPPTGTPPVATGAVTIATFDTLDDNVRWQGCEAGDTDSQAALNFPDTLTGTDTDGNDVTVSGVTWKSSPEFDPDKEIAFPGYVFTAVLPDGYALAVGVAAPVITVFVRPAGGAGITPTSVGVGNTFTVADLWFEVLTESAGNNTVKVIYDNSYIGFAGACTIPDEVGKDGIDYTVTAIDEGAFWDCDGITSITIPTSVAAIDNIAFYDCTGLTGIAVDAGNQHFSSVDGVLYDNAQTMLICYPAGKAGTTYSILNTVTTIGFHAFADCAGLTGVSIPLASQQSTPVHFTVAPGLQALPSPPASRQSATLRFSIAPGLQASPSPSASRQSATIRFPVAPGLQASPSPIPSRKSATKRFSVAPGLQA